MFVYPTVIFWIAFIPGCRNKHAMTELCITKAYQPATELRKMTRRSSSILNLIKDNFIFKVCILDLFIWAFYGDLFLNEVLSQFCILKVKVFQENHLVLAGFLNSGHWDKLGYGMLIASQLWQLQWFLHWSLVSSWHKLSAIL